MIKIKNENYLFLVILLLFLMPGLLALFIKYLPLNQQPGTDRSEKIYGEIVLEQTITALENNLDAIAVSLRNFNLLNKKMLRMILFFGNHSEVRRAEVNGANINDGDLVRFSFNPISDSLSKSYLIEFSAPDSLESEAIQVFYTKDNKVAYQDFYKPVSKVGFVLDIYTDFIRRFVSDKGFFVFYILLIAGLLYTAYKS